MGSLMASKGKTKTSIKECNSKRHKHFLSLWNLPVLNALGDKREVDLKHKQSITNDINKYNKVPTQSSMQAMCKSLANIMIAVDSKT